MVGVLADIFDPLIIKCNSEMLKYVPVNMHKIYTHQNCV